jgi:DNA-binding CsgD family transcriptional regulator
MLLWGAAQRLGIGAEAAGPAAGLAEFGTRVRFRHPLVRSAIYQAASADERRSVHGALAQATDRDLDPDGHAWHLAQASSGPDDDVAADLERSAGRAQGRGGLAAAAAFLEHAAALTLEPGRRAQRALAAAEAKHQAGAPDAALDLLAMADAGPLDELLRARVELLRAQIAFAVNRGNDAPPLLLKAAKRLEPLDARLARDTYLEALSAAMSVGRLGNGWCVLEVAQAARSAGRAGSSGEPRAADLLLDGLVALITEGPAAGTPGLERALSAFRSEQLAGDESTQWLWLACHAAALLWDDETWDLLSARHVQLARDAGALTVLPLALCSRAGMQLHAGAVAAAASLIEEVEAVATATGGRLGPYRALPLAAWQGQEARARELIEAATAEVVPRGEGIGLTVIQYCTAVLANGLGRHEDALAAAEQAGTDPHGLGYSTCALPELIEAAVRSGRPERAGHALRRLSDGTRASGSDWALGMEARSRALLSVGREAEDLYREAIDRLARTRMRAQLARARLLYGEWLRLERRRVDAREQLGAAHEMLTEMGLEAFAQRAARELLASGGTTRKRGGATGGGLTAQEATIAQLARDGLSNPEIGSQLFISPRTVEYHLRKVFGKLNINSRNQLGHVLAPVAPSVPNAGSSVAEYAG